MLLKLGITDEKDVEYFHNATKDPRGREKLRRYIDHCLLNNADFSAEGFRHYLARDLQ
ncbi:MAG: hypothetical protein QXT19_03630 [Candidatus Woesearchaeota archaeon]